MATIAVVANKSTSIPFCRKQKTKTPPGRFFQGFAVGCREHTVLRQRTKYTIEQTRNSARILTFEYGWVSNFVHKILFMHTVFIYTEDVRSERGPQFYRRNEVTAGWWCRQCLNPLK